jgi:hypothetical protein
VTQAMTPTLANGLPRKQHSAGAAAARRFDREGEALKWVDAAFRSVPDSDVTRSHVRLRRGGSALSPTGVDGLVRPGELVFVAVSRAS